MSAPAINGANRLEARLSLGSWHIFSRLSLDEGAQLVQAAIDRGINQFDIGDYWDHELLNTKRFREIVEILGLPRESYKLSVKLFTNSEQSRESLLREFNDRLGVDHVEYAVCSRPSPLETLEEAIKSMNGLVEAGLTKDISVGLWGAPLLAKAWHLMRDAGMRTPRFVQFQYNMCRRDVVESPEYTELFATTDIKLQAAFPLEGGLLAGHVHRERFGEHERERGEWFTDRNLARDSGGIRPRMREIVPELASRAATLGVSSATLAIAFAATHPATDTVLFGATTVKQLDEAVAGLALARSEPQRIRDAVEEFRIAGAAEPALFDPTLNLH